MKLDLVVLETTESHSNFSNEGTECKNLKKMFCSLMASTTLQGYPLTAARTVGIARTFKFLREAEQIQSTQHYPTKAFKHSIL